MTRKCIITTLLIMIPLALLSAAEWTLDLESTGGHPEVIADNGRSILLDEDIHFKRWNGMLLEQLTDGVYMVTDGDGDAIVLFTSEADTQGYEADYIMRQYVPDAQAVIFLTRMPDTYSFRHAEGVDVLTTHMPTSQQERTLRRYGVSPDRISSRALVAMDDGRIEAFYRHSHSRPTIGGHIIIDLDRVVVTRPWVPSGQDDGYDETIQNPWV